MTNKNKPFQATVFSKSIGVTSEVLPFGGDMAICLDQGIVIITKQQAMEFWGLVDKGVNIKSKDFEDNIDPEKCPATNQYCKNYKYDNDSNGVICVELCDNPENKNNCYGNCTRELCPILVKNN